RRLVRLAPWPLPARFRALLHPPIGPAALQTSPVASLAPFRLPLHLPPDGPQDLARADWPLPRTPLGPQPPLRLRQATPHRQQRRLGLAMHQANRPAGQRELVDRSLVDPKYAFISPSPAVKLRRRLGRQPRRIKDVGQQPDVVLGLATGRHPDQPAGDRRQAP